MLAKKRPRAPTLPSDNKQVLSSPISGTSSSLPSSYCKPWLIRIFIISLVGTCVTVNIYFFMDGMDKVIPPPSSGHELGIRISTSREQKKSLKNDSVKAASNSQAGEIMESKNGSKLSRKHSRIKSELGNVTSRFPWEDDNDAAQILPDWMKEYFTWHFEQRQTFLESSSTENNQFHFLVVRCWKTDWKCGGTADRLKPLPLAVLLAAHLRPRRILLIEWERPCALEEFLIPRGMNWTVPYEHSLFSNNIDERLKNAPMIIREKSMRALLGLSSRGGPNNEHYPDDPIVTMLYQSNDHGTNLYNEFIRKNKNMGGELETIFRHVWNVLFQPSPAVQTAIDETMNDLQLQKDNYVAAHIRSQYQSTIQGERRMVYMAKNAMHCASRFLPIDTTNTTYKNTIFVTTDNITITNMAVEYINVEKSPTQNVRAVARSVSQQPLHLDRGDAFLERDPEHWTDIQRNENGQQQPLHQPSDYYDTFVDLYLLANAKCISINVGNYGKWANLLSSDPSCINSHMKHACRWNEKL